MQYIQNGVCAPKGFLASSVHCGIRKNRTKKDLALIFSGTKCAAASVYTQNLVQGAPIIVTKKNIAGGYANAIICNSGNANTCNDNGIEIANATCQMCADQINAQLGLNIDQTDIIIASTGVIGQRLDIEPIASGLPKLVKDLSPNGSLDAAQAIMTTDITQKEVAIEFTLGGKVCKIGAIGKGSGMINPNMATMLVFITTDVNITPKMLNLALTSDIQTTFNQISVDGDTSTNDMVSVLANGEAKNPIIDNHNADFEIFCSALNTVTTHICKAIAADGEGATKLLECNVFNAKTLSDAKSASKAVISSSLLKAAMFGSDANWGRVLCALGYSGANIDVTKVDVAFTSSAGSVETCKQGYGLNFSEELAKKVLSEKEIKININLNDGSFNATAWGCDLTYDYVKINGDYRS